MSKFIVLVEVLIGYFKKIILVNWRVLQTGKHIGSTCASRCMGMDRVQHITNRLKYFDFRYLGLREYGVKSKLSGLV